MRIGGRFLQLIIEFLEAPVDEPLPKIEELSGLLPSDDDYSFEGQAEKILNLLQEASFMQTQISDKGTK
jgi:hypothetical protein